MTALAGGQCDFRHCFGRQKTGPADLKQRGKDSKKKKETTNSEHEKYRDEAGGGRASAPTLGSRHRKSWQLHGALALHSADSAPSRLTLPCRSSGISFTDWLVALSWRRFSAGREWASSEAYSLETGKGKKPRIQMWGEAQGEMQAGQMDHRDSFQQAVAMTENSAQRWHPFHPKARLFHLFLCSRNSVAFGSNSGGSLSAWLAVASVTVLEPRM